MIILISNLKSYISKSAYQSWMKMNFPKAEIPIHLLLLPSLINNILHYFPAIPPPIS